MTEVHTRRTLLAGMGAAAALAACGRHMQSSAYRVPGRIIGANWQLGHRLRESLPPPQPAETLRAHTVILGGGVAGLSAARALDQAGHSDYLLCEMADTTGGNAVAGGNEVSRYPWGAHYVPIIDPDDHALRDLFGELGIIKDLDQAGLPIYEEEYLCADPDERLWRLGQWQEGFVPRYGTTAGDRDQQTRFDALIRDWRARVGADGRRAFALPLEGSSADPDLQRLQSMTFAQFLRAQGFSSVPLLWYLDYCCRDDFGAPATIVSAWAGLHYFCARRGRAANAAHGDVLTWPQGNAFLTESMTARLRGEVRTRLLVTAIRQQSGSVQLDAFDAARAQAIRIEAGAAIVSLPLQVLKHVLPTHADRAQGSVRYPWAVANLTLSQRPGGPGAPLAWDNVAYDSRLLGYVVADHQHLGLPASQTVLTYYWPLTHLPPDEARRWALQRSHEQWCGDFLTELYFLHPELIGKVQNVDVCVWGHGMACPVPGFCSGVARAARRQPDPPLFFAHTDLAGISVFEEAFWQGHMAAAERLAWRKG